jgi:hypothetical protein
VSDLLRGSNVGVTISYLWVHYRHLQGSLSVYPITDGTGEP